MSLGTLDRQRAHGRAPRRRRPTLRRDHATMSAGAQPVWWKASATRPSPRAAIRTNTAPAAALMLSSYFLAETSQLPESLPPVETFTEPRTQIHCRQRCLGRNAEYSSSCSSVPTTSTSAAGSFVCCLRSRGGPRGFFEHSTRL